MSDKARSAARFIRAVEQYRRPLIVILHIALIVISSYLALFLRFEGGIPYLEKSLWWATIPWLLLIRCVTFAPFKLYQGLWRYTSIWDLVNIILGVFTSTAVFYVLIHTAA